MYELGSSPKSLIESLELVRLHSPPHILSKLLDICNSPDGNGDDLARVISTDAALTSRLMMALNSVAFSVREPIDDLKQAVAVLGEDLVKTMKKLASRVPQLAALFGIEAPASRGRRAGKPTPPPPPSTSEASGSVAPVSPSPEATEARPEAADEEE